MTAAFFGFALRGESGESRDGPRRVMLDFWDEQIQAGERRDLAVYVINDLHAPWKGTVRVRVTEAGQTVSTQERVVTVDALGREILTFPQPLPERRGDYTLAAELLTPGGRPVRSLRDFRVQ